MPVGYTLKFLQTRDPDASLIRNHYYGEHCNMRQCLVPTMSVLSLLTYTNQWPWVSYLTNRKRLLYTHAFDLFHIGNNIRSVFSVLTINKNNISLPVELDPFSKYTADFTVILHGIPQQHGMATIPSLATQTTHLLWPVQYTLVNRTEQHVHMHMVTDLLLYPECGIAHTIWFISLPYSCIELCLVDACGICSYCTLQVCNV